ncbi:MAG: MATE family efflux transporter [Lachnospiraceae bacterium]
MFVTGGNAIVSRYLGQGQEKQARKALTEFVVIGVLISTVFAVLVILFENPICRFLGANDELMADCKAYLTISMLFATGLHAADTVSVVFCHGFQTGTWAVADRCSRNFKCGAGLCADCTDSAWNRGRSAGDWIRTAASCCGGIDLFCNSA